MTVSSQRQKPGPGKPLTAQRELYLRLMKQGPNNSEACRLLGIHRKTGQRWRHGRRHRVRGREYYYRPISAPPLTVSARFLSEDERVRIADLHRAGGRHGRSPPSWAATRRRSAGSCAATADPAPGSTGRSRRSGWPPAGGRGPAGASWSPMRCCAGSWPSGCGRRWSPEQISQALRAEFPTSRSGIWCPRRSTRRSTAGVGGLRRELPIALRTGRRRRKPHRRGPMSAARAAGGHDHDRSATRRGRRPSVPGHWEGDLIIGENNRSAIGTLVERSSRFVVLLHLPGRHTAEAVRDALVQALGQLPPQLRRSLTWDQGAEMALHAEIAQSSACRCSSARRPARGSGPATRTPTGCCASTSRRAPTCGCTGRGSGRGGRRTQRPTPQDPRLANTGPAPHISGYAARLCW